MHSQDESSDNDEEINKLPDHHKKLEYCTIRKEYRKGKRSTAVKVFTVNTESKYIMVRNVHATGLEKDLLKVYSKYGTVVQCQDMKDYPREPFTQVFVIKFDDIHSARVAKRQTDEMYFFGSMLHVFYAAEFESVNETRQKLMTRRRDVVSRLRNLSKEEKNEKLKDTGTSNANVRLPVKPGAQPSHMNWEGTFAKLTSTVLQSVISPSLSQSSNPQIILDKPQSGTFINTDNKSLPNVVKPTKSKFTQRSGYLPPQRNAPNKFVTNIKPGPFNEGNTTGLNPEIINKELQKTKETFICRVPNIPADDDESKVECSFTKACATKRTANFFDEYNNAKLKKS